MSTDKTPLHSVVSVICDCLSTLSADDQARALEAARVSLGLLAPVTQAPREASIDVRPLRSLPTVQVEMMSGAPVVVSPPMPTRRGRAMVVLGPQRQVPMRRIEAREAAVSQPPRQLPAPRVQEPQAQTRGYVRALR